MLWYFWVYSFLGYLLEKAFAKATKAAQQGRKGVLALPLCPVYGLGMLAVLALPEEWQTSWRLALAGGIAATAVEYAVHWAYQRFLGPFSAVWGLLVWAAVTWVQPGVKALAERVPPEVTLLCLLAFAVDAVCSLWLLHRWGDPEVLRADVDSELSN